MPPITSAPAKFQYHLRFDIRTFRNQPIWKYLYQLFHFTECDGSGDPPFREEYGYPTQGYNDWNGIDVWVTNQRKQGYIILSFHSKDEWEKIRAMLNVHIRAGNSMTKLPIYKFDTRANLWIKSSYYEAKPPEQLVGFDHYIEVITNAIDNFISHVDFLKKVGEMKALNFLLYGNPGMGKTSLIKLIATKYNAPICIVNPLDTSVKHIDRILNPNISSQDYSSIIILVFEDFDRFLSDQDGEKIMNLLLNGIDGLSNSFSRNIVRFFTGNDCKIVLKNKALINRMSHKFSFANPSREMYKSKMEQLFSFHRSYDEKLAEEFLDKVCKQNPPMSMRPFINYILIYLFDDNFLEKLCERLK